MKYIFALIALTVFLAGCDSTECPQDELYLDHYEYMELIDGSMIARPVYYCGAPSLYEPDNSTFFYHNSMDSLDDLITQNAAISSSGKILLSSQTTAYAYKTVTNLNPDVSFANDWKFKSVFTIASGTGQYLSTSTTTNGFKSYIQDTTPDQNAFGVRLAWNQSTSMIDIYAYTRGAHGISNNLITSINDIGQTVHAECVLTAGVDMVAAVTISGTTYTTTITTNLPSGNEWMYVMYNHVSGSSGTVDIYLDDFESTQF